MATCISEVVMVTGEPESELWPPGLWVPWATGLKDTSICLLVQARNIVRISEISQQGVACRCMHVKERHSHGPLHINVSLHQPEQCPRTYHTISPCFLLPTHEEPGRITTCLQLSKWRNHEPFPGILVRWKIRNNIFLGCKEKLSSLKMSCAKKEKKMSCAALWRVDWRKEVKGKAKNFR